MKFNPLNTETICALSTPAGTGAIAVIRVSGKDALKICGNIFRKADLKTYELSSLTSHTVHYGKITDNDIVIDGVLLTVFKAPHSYTGEDVVEISCHGSTHIQQKILESLFKQGARLAKAGEFTLRAFLNKKMDLSQAEAIADLIASRSETSHHLAMQQMRGGFSNKIKELREQLVYFASLIELELDFSEENVEFASRDELKKIISSIQNTIRQLITSFELGNALKNGVPVCIAGKPNCGKSTLLNALLEEERAIVSDIPGTTRDTIEDEIVIEGIRFRFIDTAGIRHTTDAVETLGVSRTYRAMQQASVVIYIFDAYELPLKELEEELKNLQPYLFRQKIILTGNKIDKFKNDSYEKKFRQSRNPSPGGFLDKEIVFISAKEKTNIAELKKELVEYFSAQKIQLPDVVVTNVRHLEALQKTNEALERTKEGLEKKLSGELLASDIREALHYLGLITGEVTTDDLLHSIFSRFCIGK